MNLDTYFKDLIQDAVRSVVKEEVASLAEKIQMEGHALSKKDQTLPQKRVIRPKELSKMLSVSITTLYRMELEGRLPDKVRFGSNAVGWLSTDIDEWMEKRKLD